MGRIIVSGLIFEPEESIEMIDVDDFYNNHRSSFNHYRVGSFDLPNSNIQISQQQTFYNAPFLRRSYNRIDALAVCSYWIDLLLTMIGVQHFLLFRALSTLRYEGKKPIFTNP